MPSINNLTKTTPRTRLTSLANLPPSHTRLAFRSLPYSSPPHLLNRKPSETTTFHSPLFTLRCSPSISRSSPPSSSGRKPLIRNQFISPPTISYENQGSNRPYTLDLTIRVGKKQVHKRAVIRGRCKRRFWEAIRIVVRGALVPPSSSSTALSSSLSAQEEIQFDGERSGPRKWLLPGYTYIATLTPKIYLHPFPDLVRVVQSALREIKGKVEGRKYQDALVEEWKRVESESAANDST